MYRCENVFILITALLVHDIRKEELVKLLDAVSHFRSYHRGVLLRELKLPQIKQKIHNSIVSSSNL